MREKSCLRAGVIVEIFGNTTVELGKNSYINYCSNINAGGRAGISIGADCAIAWNVQLISYDYHAMVKPDGTSSSWALPITIGDHCWIGAGATILKGVTLGSHSIVAAGAVLTNGNYPDHSDCRQPWSHNPRRSPWRNLKTPRRLVYRINQESALRQYSARYKSVTRSQSYSPTFATAFSRIRSRSS